MKKNKRLLFVVIVLLVILVTVFLFLYFKLKDKGTFASYSVTQVKEVTAGYSMEYTEYGSGDSRGFIEYNSDGASAYRTDGSAIWNFAYDISKPIVRGSGEYTVVAESGGKILDIIDKSGDAKTFTMNDDIVLADIASNGVAAVLTQNGTKNHVYLYSTDSKDALVDKYTTIEDNGFPVAVAESVDGKKLALSYMETENGTINSWITFYNFGNVGSNQVDNLVGSFEYKGSVAPDINFTSQNYLTSFRDTGIELYSMTQVPEVSLTADFTDKVKSVAESDNYSCVVFEAETGKSCHVQIYDNKKCSMAGEFDISFDFDHVMFMGDRLLMYSKNAFHILNIDGSICYETDFTSDIDTIISSGSADSFLMVTAGKIELINFK